MYKMDGIQRIKVLAMEIKDKPLLKIVDYLLTRTDMNDKYLNEEKTLKQMVDFIKQNAKKEAKNGIAMINDDVVYGWAIHYFDETNKDLELSENNHEKNIQKNSEKNKNDNYIKKEKWVAEGQLSLFDICM